MNWTITAILSQNSKVNVYEKSSWKCDLLNQAEFSHIIPHSTNVWKQHDSCWSWIVLRYLLLWSAQLWRLLSMCMVVPNHFLWFVWWLEFVQHGNGAVVQWGKPWLTPAAFIRVAVWVPAASLAFRLPAGEPGSLAPVWVSQKKRMAHLDNEWARSEEKSSFVLWLSFSLCTLKIHTYIHAFSC